jgi:hypothetical protein
MQQFLRFADEPFADDMERNSTYISRGGVYVIYIQRGRAWRAGISTDPANPDALIRLNRKQIKRLIETLKIAKQ